MNRLFFLLLALPAMSQTPVEQLDAALQARFRADAPGAAVLVMQAGNVVLRKGYGLARLDAPVPITPGTLFRMASVSKQFTAMAVLLLAERGKLNLNDSLSRFLPDFNPTVGGRVRLRHLLTHSAGILDYEEKVDSASFQHQVSDADVLALVQAHPTTYFEPGSQFQYSNTGFCLLSLVIEKASGEPFGQFLAENIFRPLGMDRTALYETAQSRPDRALGYARDAQGHAQPSDQSLTSATRGDGCVYTCLDDYLSWAEALRRNRLLDLPKWLNKISFSVKEGTDVRYGLGWFFSEKTPLELSHTGSTCGFSNGVWLVPERNLAVVYFSNLADAHKEFSEVETLARTLFGGSPRVLWSETLDATR